MAYKDLKGNEITPGCYYYSIANGSVEEHKYAEGRTADENRLKTGKVLWCGSVNNRFTAQRFFESKKIRNTGG